MTSTDAEATRDELHRRILFIGDSFATESLARKIEVELRGIIQEEMNVDRIGFPGGGLRHIFPPVLEALEKAPPTLIIHVYPDCDAIRHWSPMRRWRTKNMTSTSNAEFSLFMKRLAWCRDLHPPLAAPFERIYRAIYFGEAGYREGIEQDIQLLDDFADRVETMGHRYICVFWEIRMYGLRRYFEQRLGTLNKDRKRVFTSFNDWLSVYQEQDITVSPSDLHPNITGENLFALFIAETLKHEFVSS